MFDIMLSDFIRRIIGVILLLLIGFVISKERKKPSFSKTLARHTPTAL